MSKMTLYNFMIPEKMKRDMMYALEERYPNKRKGLLAPFFRVCMRHYLTHTIPEEWYDEIERDYQRYNEKGGVEV